MDFTNTAPAAITIPNVDFTNTAPAAIGITDAKRHYLFGSSGSFPSATWSNSGSDNVYELTDIPFPVQFRPVDPYPVNMVLVYHSIAPDVTVPVAQWGTYVFPKGSSITLKITNTLSYNGSNVGLIVQGSHAPEAITVP